MATTTTVKRELDMEFETESGSTFRVKVPDVRENLDGEEVSASMDDMIGMEVLINKKGELAAYSRRAVEVATTRVENELFTTY